MPSRKVITRPIGITLLSICSFVSTGITLLASLSLLFPKGALESIWRLNPRARAGLGAIGLWAVLLFFVVGVTCFIVGIGLWRGKRWGYVMAIVGLCIDALGDLFNALSGREPRAIVGVPVVVLILAYLLTRRIRLFFGSPWHGTSERNTIPRATTHTYISGANNTRTSKGLKQPKSSQAILKLNSHKPFSSKTNR